MSTQLGAVPRVLIASAILLLIGSLVAALSNTIGPLLVGRALQGLAMGFIPVGISLIREVTPRQLASRSIAAMSATLGVGAAVGLPLAAWIDEVSSWHALFWMEAGVALVMVILAAILVPHLRDGVPGRFDITGGLGLTAGLVLFLVGISKGNDWGWATGRTVGAIVAGIVVLVLWAVFELRQREPLVDLRTSAARPVLMTNIAAVAVGFGMMAASVVMPQLVQLPEVTGYGMGLSVLQAGLLMAPAGFAMMLAAVFSTRVIAQFGAKAALMVGATVLGAGYVLSFFLMDAPWQLLVSSCVCLAGVGIGYAAMPTVILDSVPGKEAASAVGLNALMRSIGTTLAAAVMATVLTSDSTSFGAFVLPTASAFRWCFLIAAAAAFLGVAIAATIPRVKARSSHRLDSELVGADPARGQ